MELVANIVAMCEKELSIFVMLMILMTSRQYNSVCEASSWSTSAQNDYLRNEMPQERMEEQIKTPKDQTLVVRLPLNPLLKYYSYKDVSILHFRMPPDTRRAVFTFKAIEESKSAFQRKCKPRDVTLYLKASSYPVISPENITFPKNFLSAAQRFKIYNLQFLSDELPNRITIDGPQIGNWFAVAFVSWTDPSNDRIEQQGLAASCETLLLAEMSASLFLPIILSNGQEHNSTLISNRIVHNVTTKDSQNNDVKCESKTVVNIQQQTNHQPNQKPLINVQHANSTLCKIDRNETQLNGKLAPITEIPLVNLTAPSSNATLYSSRLCSELRNKSDVSANNEIIYKFYVPRDIGVATAQIRFGDICLQCPQVDFLIQANAFPVTGGEDKKSHELNYIHSVVFKPNETAEVSKKFHVQPMTWHYALLRFVNLNGSVYNGSSDNENLVLKHDQVQLKNSTDAACASQKATSYQLPFVLRIDYQALPEHNSAKVNSNNEEDPIKKRKEKYKIAHEVVKKKESNEAWSPKQFRGMDFYPVLRQTYHEFFMYDYDLMPDENGTVPTLLNLTAGMSVGFAFHVGEVSDIGGTLSFAVSMNHDNKATNLKKAIPPISTTKERSGILAEKLIGSPDISSGLDNRIGTNIKNMNNKTLPHSNQTIIVCMNLGEPGEPTWPDKCRYGRRFLPASSIVNNTDLNTITGLIHVPFPESGQWYITMGLYCHGAETASRMIIIDSVKDFVKNYAHMLEFMQPPCACASKIQRYLKCVNDPGCLSAMNETETLKIKECLLDAKCTSNHVEMTHKFEVHHKFATEQRFALENCSTSVVFTISSSPCVAGRCGRYGRCYHYMSGGFVFSTCICMKGYRGWDCTENSQVPSSVSILIASLLLTLSNLLFFPSIYIAIRRQFYNEAIIYFFAMFFSIFYHACDSGEDEYSFCLVKISVLQFCDFYCGLLAIWVTLVAMSHIQQQIVSLLHMLGAILLAFGTELNKQSLWVFLAPALTGIFIISVSWGMRCYKSRKWFPARRYLMIYMPLGTVLVIVGLVCYAFLQTKQNYHIVHSVWHMVMASSIWCLLPSRTSFIPKC